MPIYEFHCKSCGEEFEELVLKRDDTSDVQCPSCESADVERLQSGFATVSGGSGSAAGSSCSSSGPFT